MKFFLALAALCGISPCIYADEPVDFTCPRPGTIEQRSLSQRKYVGVDPTDHYICVRHSFTGQIEAMLFNFFPLTDDDSNRVIRSSMIALLSFSSKSVSFSNITQNRFLWYQTWTFLRREPLTIGGRTFNTLVLREDGEQMAGAQQHGQWDRWLDPETGLWLKATYKHISGMEKGVSAYEDTEVILP